MNKCLWISAVLVFSLSMSCKVSNGGQSITEFLENQANQVKIDRLAFSEDFPLDREGFVSIPSRSDAVVNYLIKNPAGLKITDYGILADKGIGLNFHLNEEKVQAVDEQGNPAVDGEGNPVYVPYYQYELVGDSSEAENPAVYTVKNNGKSVLTGADYYTLENRGNHTLSMKLGQNFLYRLERENPGITLNPALGISVDNYNYDKINTTFYDALHQIVAASDAALASGEASSYDFDSDSAVHTKGNFEVNVNPYIPKIRINSPPPPVQGACVMVDTTDNTRPIYVLCFNLPDCLFLQGGIHRDMQGGESQEEDGLKGRITITGLGKNSDDGYSSGIPLRIVPDTEIGDGSRGSFTSRLPHAPPSSHTLSKIAEINRYSENGMPAVEFNAENHPVYILDLDHRVQDRIDRAYTITLTDEKGLSSTVTLNARFYQLDEVSAWKGKHRYNTGAVYITFPADDEGNELVDSELLNLLAPTKIANSENLSVSDVDIYYEIWSLDMFRDPHNTGVIYTEVGSYESNRSRSSKLLTLENHTVYRISAYARKEGYLDSKVSHWFVTSGNYRYVPVSVETGTSSYGVEFAVDRWNTTTDGNGNPLWETVDENTGATEPGEYNFVVFKETDDQGRPVYSYDLTANMKVRLYDKQAYDSTGEKNYLSEEETKAAVKSLKLILRENSGIEMMSYINNEYGNNGEVVSVCSQIVSDDISGDSRYISEKGEVLTERQDTVPITLPSKIVNHAADGDIYYRLEMEAEIGNSSTVYSDIIDIPVRFIAGPAVNP